MLDLHPLLRRERDSNPRNLSVQRFSRPPQSTTLPSLLVSKTGAKVDGLFELCKFFISFLFIFFVFHSSISDSQTHKKIRFLLLCTGTGYKLCIEKLKHSF